jgi:hypothetical protein
MNNIKNIQEEALKALSLLENGETYPLKYVLDRLEKSAGSHPGDIVINNMRDVIRKTASKHMFITQKDIGKLYNDLYGLSGGHTAFRRELEDLLPESLKIAKVAYTSSNLRTMDEAPTESIYKDSDLSNAFSVLFNMKNKSASEHHIDYKEVKSIVLNKLASIGHIPVELSIVNQNEHFILASAKYKDRKHNELNVNIPVQIVNGKPQNPSFMIQGDGTVELNNRNLSMQLKEESLYRKANAKTSIGGDIARDSIDIGSFSLPKELSDYADVTNNLIKAASFFKQEQVNLGLELVNAEVLGLTHVRPEIKVGSANESGIVFIAKFAFPKGETVVEIPVEYHNGRPILPSKFATNLNGERNHYDFDKSGFNSLLNNISANADYHSNISRVSSSLNEMNYSQLMDQLISGVSRKDYKLSEDAISVISAKFGPEEGMNALNKYSQLLRTNNTVSKSREDFIKSAKARGELISAFRDEELYSPKLGLPVSRIDFDESGRMYPKGRLPKYENLNSVDEVISTSRIILT